MFKRLFLVITLAAMSMLWATAGETAKVKYTEVEVTGGGRIAGRVSWKGPHVTVPLMKINKNAETCDVGGDGTRTSPRLLMSSSGGVANCVIYINAIAQGKPMPKGDLLINQKGCRYIPHISIAPRKSKITLKSSDDVLHNIHMLGAANYNIPFPDKNSVVKTFRKAGIVRVQCDAGHGWMSSYIHVVNHPYYAITGEDGNFELTDVPPGEYTLTMWHEDWVTIGEVIKEGEVVGYEFGEPIQKSQQVTVTASVDTKVVFSISK